MVRISAQVLMERAEVIMLHPERVVRSNDAESVKVLAAAASDTLIRDALLRTDNPSLAGMWAWVGHNAQKHGFNARTAANCLALASCAAQSESMTAILLADALKLDSQHTLARLLAQVLGAGIYDKTMVNVCEAVEKSREEVCEAPKLLTFENWDVAVSA